MSADEGEISCDAVRDILVQKEGRGCSDSCKSVMSISPIADSLVERREAAQTVEIRGCKSQGLGIRIVGGRNMTLADGRLSDFGIFVKEVIPNGLADKDGNYAVALAANYLFLSLYQ